MSTTLSIMWPYVQKSKKVDRGESALARNWDQTSANRLVQASTMAVVCSGGASLMRYGP